MSKRMPLPENGNKIVPPSRSLFGSSEPGEKLDGARLLPVELIDANPRQPRQVFNADADAELLSSVRELGVVQPIVVRPQAGRYQIVAGERRWRAAVAAELLHIPAIIRPLSDEEAAILAIVENLQREDLDIEDETRQLAELQSLSGLSDRALAERLHKSKSWINDRMRIHRRAPELLDRIRSGELTLKTALDLIPAGEADGGVSAARTPTLPLPVEPTTAEAEAADGGQIERPAMDTEVSARRTLKSSYGGVSARRTPGEPVPWRRRPLNSFSEWVARVDETTVPRQERQTVIAEILQIEERLARIRERLGAEQQADKDSIEVNGKRGDQG